MQKEDILAEIRRTTEENNGKPLGVDRFARQTGIGPYEWSRFWPRFSEAQREAGFEPNTLKGAYADDYMLAKLSELVRELRHFPVKNEIRIKKRSDPEFPSQDAYERLGNKSQLIAKTLIFCQSRADYADVAKLVEPLASLHHTSKASNNVGTENQRYGFVYLVKGHPGEYKIGRTNLVDRRLSELGATASIEQQLVHEIKTDDPAGIEAYWHKRFQDKRMRGEWFRLNADDVRAFKRWRKIF